MQTETQRSGNSSMNLTGGYNMKKYSHSDELNFTWVFDIYPTDIK